MLFTKNSVVTSSTSASAICARRGRVSRPVRRDPPTRPRPSFRPSCELALMARRLATVPWPARPRRRSRRRIQPGASRSARRAAPDCGRWQRTSSTRGSRAPRRRRPARRRMRTTATSPRAIDGSPRPTGAGGETNRDSCARAAPRTSSRPARFTHARTSVSAAARVRTYNAVENRVLTLPTMPGGREAHAIEILLPHVRGVTALHERLKDSVHLARGRADVRGWLQSRDGAEPKTAGVRQELPLDGDGHHDVHLLSGFQSPETTWCHADDGIRAAAKANGRPSTSRLPANRRCQKP